MLREMLIEAHRDRVKRIARAAYRPASPPLVIVAPTEPSAPVERDWLHVASSGFDDFGTAPIKTIIAATARHYRMPIAEIYAHRRTATIVRPRQVAMYLCKTMTPRSLPEIGRRCGGRDHTTVLHAVRKIEALVQTDAKLASDVAEIRDAIEWEVMR